MIGQRVRRREDPRFITGKGQYDVRHIDMPANGERVWRAIHDARPQ